MPGTIQNAPAVSLSFANNFWGKDDAGVEPLLQRMQNAKQTCDELKSFYSSRSAIEDEYARKLLSLSRKSLATQETGTLRASLDVLRGEIEQMGKSHQNIASQIKTELEEPLAAFAGAMKERRKIVQTGIERLHKVKIQQTNQVNKTRDRYEQECLKIKGYLAQGHMVMGQEERKNKAKLEKTQIHLATSSTEYENAVKALEETTGRWNRDWKAAADKFQDLEEERLDFTKSSLWSFANISSTVCVSDDASCEKIRLSLEKCEVEKDIAAFIKDCGTGQEIPDPPKYINFCRGDASDSQSETSDEDHYSVAQFQRTINPAYRSSSPQPSTYESHHNSNQKLSGRDPDYGSVSPSALEEIENQTTRQNKYRQPHLEDISDPRDSAANYQVRPPREQQRIEQNIERIREPQIDNQPNQQDAQFMRQKPRDRKPVENGTQFNKQPPPEQSIQYSQHEYQNQPEIPHYQTPQKLSKESLNSSPRDPYPINGMTLSQRTALQPDRSPARSSGASSSSRDLLGEQTSPSSHDAISGKTSPVKQNVSPVESPAFKKKMGFFQNHVPFRRRSKSNDNSRILTPLNKNTWSARTTANSQNSAIKDQQIYNQGPKISGKNRVSHSPEIIDPLASLQLNVGNNVFDVQTPDQNGQAIHKPNTQGDKDLDPIAQALAELKGVTKASSTRVSADKYHGIATPTPVATLQSRPISTQMSNNAILAGQRGTPPPSYDLPVQRLGLPQPAFTSKAMQHTKQKYVAQTQNIFKAQGSPEPRVAHDSGFNSRPSTRGKEMPRALSPAPPRNISPRVEMGSRQSYRSASPNPYLENQENHQQFRQHVRGSDQGYYMQKSSNDIRAASPAVYRESARSSSRNMSTNDIPMQMQMQITPGPEDYYGSHGRRSSRASGSMSPRPMSRYGNVGNQQLETRQRSKSVADVRQYNSQGRPILHFARALYNYQAAIPEELCFRKGDILAVLRHQDDGWWEAEVAGKNEKPGLVPSNYVQNC
ncbi:putative contractile ring protein imp2 [Golovinomyces cichoracearum]|uniref:Putative contractile ring protein imp2 n=1 Tax=Golovinomyces cichoracearum TaxID=62708 RepID=A0A420HGZ9_9PEZI|nr:putative contractile ring protein imp2 [Golovinomyces cichoracearum]